MSSSADAARPARRVPPPRRPRRPLRGRVRRRPLLLGVLGVALVTGLLLLALTTRPTLQSGGALTLTDAHEGTAYAFDGVVCLSSGSVGATVTDVEVEQVPGASVQLVALAAEAPPTLGFPVPDGDGPSLVGRVLTGGEQDCLTRLLVTPDEQGSVQVGQVQVTLGYGPGVPRSATLTPEVVVQTTRTGPDPRLSGS